MPAKTRQKFWLLECCLGHRGANPDVRTVLTAYVSLRAARVVARAALGSGTNAYSDSDAVTLPGRLALNRSIVCARAP